MRGLSSAMALFSALFSLQPALTHHRCATSSMSPIAGSSSSEALARSLRPSRSSSRSSRSSPAILRERARFEVSDGTHPSSASYIIQPNSSDTPPPPIAPPRRNASPPPARRFPLRRSPPRRHRAHRRDAQLVATSPRRSPPRRRDARLRRGPRRGRAHPSLHRDAPAAALPAATLAAVTPPRSPLRRPTRRDVAARLLAATATPRSRRPAAADRRQPPRARAAIATCRCAPLKCDNTQRTQLPVKAAACLASCEKAAAAAHTRETPGRINDKETKQGATRPAASPAQALRKPCASPALALR